MSSFYAQERQSGVIITHPNRDKPVVQATRATVVLLLLVSAGLLLIVTIGGWSVLEGAVPIQIAYIVVYLTFAFYAARWNRGVLPISAVLGVLLDLRGRRDARLVRPQQVRICSAGAEHGAARGRDAAGRARAAPAGHVLPARLQPGLERGARAPRPGDGHGRGAARAGAPRLSPSRRTLIASGQ